MTENSECSERPKPRDLRMLTAFRPQLLAPQAGEAWLWSPLMADLRGDRMLRQLTFQEMVVYVRYQYVSLLARIQKNEGARGRNEGNREIKRQKKGEEKSQGFVFEKGLFSEAGGQQIVS